MRTLRQPGPVHPARIEAFAAAPRRLTLTLPAGASLQQAVAEPLAAAGFQCATVSFAGAALNPFRYVMPNPSPDQAHVAWFSATQAPEGTSRIELANATFGWADAAPAIHCHAVWHEPDGARRGGHILPADTYLSAPAEATAWGFRQVRIATRADPETNFSLFQPSEFQPSEVQPPGFHPSGEPAPGTSDIPGTSGVVARVKPNQDILAAMETVAAAHGMRDAVVRGSLGSLVGACFTDGTTVPDDATEVLVRRGFVRDGRAALDLLAVDMRGRVHEGWLARGANPVCITFDLFLQASAGG